MNRLIQLTEYPREVELSTLAHRMQCGTVSVDWVGNENTYAQDEFGNEFYAKDYGQLSGLIDWCEL